MARFQQRNDRKGGAGAARMTEGWGLWKNPRPPGEEAVRPTARCAPVLVVVDGKPVSISQSDLDELMSLIRATRVAMRCMLQHHETLEKRAKAGAAIETGEHSWNTLSHRTLELLGL